MLYEHQRKLIERNPAKTGIFHDVGCGKTISSLKLVERNNPKNCLIITTKSLKLNWEREITQWVPDIPTVFSVYSKEEFRKVASVMLPYEALIVDEFHFFGNFKSQLSKSLMKYIKRTSPKYIWGLTATPVLSSVMSVWTLSVLLGNPLRNFTNFKHKYFYEIRMGHRMIPVQKKNIEKDISEDLRKIGDVVSKDDALDLPESVHLFEYFDLTSEQKKAIKDLDKDPTTTAPIVYYTKVLQIANGTLKQESGNREFICEKITRIKELVSQYRKCVIVARHRAELEMLHKHLPGSYIYDGQTSLRDREKIVARQHDRDFVVLLQSEMGIGFNLQEVSLMIFYSHTWDFVKYYQCVGRIHRIGQINKCTYIHLLVPDTVDMDVWECLLRKKSFDVELYHRDKVS